MGLFAQFSAYFANPLDSDEDIRRKRLLPLVAATLVPYVYWVGTTYGNAYNFIWNVVKFAWLLFVLVYARATRTFPRWLCEGTILFIFLQSCILNDLVTYGRKEYWALAVLMMDCLLLARAGNMVTVISFAIMFCYIIVITLEQAYALWLFPLLEDIGAGEQPPRCIRSQDGPSVVINRMMVFGFDFYLTRRFSYTMFKQQDEMKQAISSAEQIASALVRFDLIRADAIICDASIPDGLSLGFQSLVDNLKKYRPYLPHSVLPDCLDEGSYRGSADSSFRTPTHEETTASFSKVEEESLSNTLSSVHILETLQRKQVTLLVANLRHFTLGTNTPDRLIQVVGEFLDDSVQCVARHRGLLDYFHGDHLQFSFNAAKPCPYQHGVHGVTAALELCRLRFLTDYRMLLDESCPSATQEVSVGVTSGQALCGVAGTETTKGFNIIGTVTTRAHRLERLAAAKDYRILTCSRLKKEATPLAHCKLVEQVLFAKESNFTMVWALTGEKNVSEDEWMYQLEESKKQDIWNDYNTAKRAIIEGDTSLFEQLMDTTCHMADSVVAELKEDFSNSKCYSRRCFEVPDVALLPSRVFGCVDVTQ